MNKKERMYQRIRKHGEDLKRIFNLKDDVDPVKLCKKLRTIEKKIDRINEKECNTGELQSVEKTRLLCKAKALLFPNTESLLKGNFDTGLYNAVFANGDPRGYALKIDSDYIRKNDVYIHRDLGGNGIVAPDLTND